MKREAMLYTDRLIHKNSDDFKREASPMTTIFSVVRKLFLMAVIMPFIAQTQNPIIQTKYTADPAPMVYDDTAYLYTGHDEDHALGFEMHDWLLYTSTDMVNWTDHGAVASLKDFKWVPYDNGAWAAQCVHRNGRFYLYCPMPNGIGIGVLVSASPYGPFEDPLGKPLIKNGRQDAELTPVKFKP